MTKAEAQRYAVELWGQPVFAQNVSHLERNKRFIVGIFGPGTGEPLPLGAGDSWEAAFGDSQIRGFTGAKVASIRQELKERLEELERDAYEREANEFVVRCVEKLPPGEDSPEFRKQAREYFDQRERERQAAEPVEPEATETPEESPPAEEPSLIATKFTWGEQAKLGMVAARKVQLPKHFLSSLNLNLKGPKQ